MRGFLESRPGTLKQGTTLEAAEKKVFLLPQN
jgi:hypothetical protein